MANDIKRVVWKNGEPFGIYTPTGETVKFNSLHFNGKAKSLMPLYCTAPVKRQGLSSRRALDESRDVLHTSARR
jgi:hypothetical protein